MKKKQTLFLLMVFVVAMAYPLVGNAQPSTAPDDNLDKWALLARKDVMSRLGAYDIQSSFDVWGNLTHSSSNTYGWASDRWINCFTADEAEALGGITLKTGDENGADVSSCTYLYLTIYATQADNVYIALCNVYSGDWSGSYEGGLHKDLVAGWNYLKIPLTDFGSNPDLTNIWQIAFKEIDKGTSLYFSDVLFYKPLAKPATPSYPSSVLSIYSDDKGYVDGYTGENFRNLMRGHQWSASSGYNTKVYADATSDYLFQIPTFNYLGVEHSNQDITSYNVLSLDVYAVNRDLTLGVYPIIRTDGAADGAFNDAAKQSFTCPQGQWKHIQVDMDAFKTTYAGTWGTWSPLLAGQLKIDGGSGSDEFYLDNIYYSIEDLGVKAPLSYPTPSVTGAYKGLYTSGTFTDAASWNGTANGTFEDYSTAGHTIQHVTANGNEVVYNWYDPSVSLGCLNKVHVDVWPMDGVTHLYFKVYTNAGDKTADVDVTPGEWNGIDVDLGGTDLTFYGIRFNESSSTNGFTSGREFYWTNLYAYNETPSSLTVNTTAASTSVRNEHTTNVSTTVTDGCGNAVAPSSLTVTYTVSDGTKATINANGVYTATAAGEVTVTATAKVGSTTETGTVTITNTELIVPESPNPTLKAKDVFSIYGTYYGHLDYVDNIYSTWGCADETINPSAKFAADDSHNYLAVYGFGWFGFAWGAKTYDVSKYDRLHVDIYTEDGDEVRITPITKTGDAEQIDLSGSFTKQTTTAGAWKSIDIDLTDDALSSLDFENLYQIAINDGNGGFIAVDNVYFYKSDQSLEAPATTDVDDPAGISWTSSTGAKDYVYRVIVPKGLKDVPDDADVITQTSAAYHDWDITSHETCEFGLEDVYFVAQLYDKIKVSDVEIIWSNGYASDYDVYLTDEWPLENHNILSSAVTDAKKLYSVSNQKIDYEPYYDITSYLQEKNLEGQFVVFHFKKLGNSFFGFAPNEIHVGAYTADYETVDHVAADDFTTHSGYANIKRDVTVTARNSRNVSIKNKEVTDANLTCDNQLVKIEKNSNGTFSVYATGSGTGQFTLNATGTVDGAAKSGSSTMTVNDDWKTRGSIIQGKTVTVSKVESARDGEGLSEYTGDKIADWKEAEDDESRWSTHGEGGSDNEWVVIDLEKPYSMTDLEIVWEGAYAKIYSVYGFTEEPEMYERANATAAEEWRTANSSHIIIDSKDLGTKTAFPYHDVSSAVATDLVPTPNMVQNTGNQARYLVLDLKTRATSYGFSIWEVYASGVDVSVLNNVDALRAPNIKMLVNSKRTQSVTAYNTAEPDNEEKQVEGHRPVTFTLYSDEACTVPVETPDEKATFFDNTDGTYEISGLTLGTYYVKMTSTNVGTGHEMTGTFKLEVVNEKVPMKLDPGRSTADNFVYDDGYYSETVLRNDASRTVKTIDLRSVDFTNTKVEGDGEDLSRSTIPAPRTIGSGSSKMNPNVIIYTDEPDVQGTENLARLQGDGSWKIMDLIIFDGWDYAPFGGIVAQRARYYTNIPAKGYSFMLLPFTPRYSDLTRQGVTFYEPTELKDNADGSKRIHLEPLSQSAIESSGFEGVPFVVYTENTAMYKSDGYACVFASVGYKNDLSAAQSVAIVNEAKSKAISGATFQGTYVFDNTLNDKGLYWYDSYTDTFKLIENEYTLPPFFAYMTLAGGGGAKSIFFTVGDDDDELTGISGVEADKAPVDVYTLDGMLLKKQVNPDEALRGLKKGIYIVNGQKVVK